MPHPRSRPSSPSGASRIRQGHVNSSSTTTGSTPMAVPGGTSTSTPVSEIWDPVDTLSRDKEKLHPTLEIVVASDVLCLRGLGAEVEPALLSGNVVLYLPEDTPVKDITLHFRGKARLPPASDSWVPKLSACGIEYLMQSLGCT